MQYGTINVQQQFVISLSQFVQYLEELFKSVKENQSEILLSWSYQRLAPNTKIRYPPLGL